MWCYLREKFVEWCALVSGEGPCHATSCCGDADSAGPSQSKYDCAHDGSTGDVADGVLENLYEWIDVVRVKHFLCITKTEQRGEHHGEPYCAVETHAGNDGAGDVDCSIGDFFCEMNRSICADESRDIAEEADTVAQALGGPASPRSCQQTRIGTFMTSRVEGDVSASVKSNT